MNDDGIHLDEDIFGRDKEWQEGKKRQAETEEQIHLLVNSLCQQLSLQEVNDVPDLSYFALPANWDLGTDIKCFRSADKILPITFIIDYYDTEGAMHYDDASVLAIIHLKQEYPATYLHKEHLKDRLVDLIQKTDIDFKEHKKFSSAFHLVSTDEQTIRYRLANKQLDMLADFPSLELVIKDKQCLYKLYNEGLNEKQITEIVAVTKHLLKILS